MPSLAIHRLRKHADYQRVYKAGRKQFGKGMAYFFALRDPASAARSDTVGPRVGLTVPKALGKAVARNRIKRRLRAAVRDALPALSAPVDLVLHPKRIVLDADFASIEREVLTIFRSVQAATERAAAAAARSSAANKPAALHSPAKLAETAAP
ncbi:MAG TPA: ribonuclease P protein component [Acidobacteriaceae bacterium]|jgi:ribonuclease P protein component|nr:ribonuclease P protein component [Acidobacteriaceae bacterium]